MKTVNSRPKLIELCFGVVLILAVAPYWVEALFHVHSGLTNSQDVIFWAIVPLLSIVALILLFATTSTRRLLLWIRSLTLKRELVIAAGILLIAGAAYLWFVVMAHFQQARDLYGILLVWMVFVFSLAIFQSHHPMSGALLLTVIVGTGFLIAQVIQVSRLIDKVTVLETKTPGGYADAYDYGLANPDFYPFLVFDAQPALPIPSLTDLAGAATTDAEVVQNVVNYYDAHVDDLSKLFQEDDTDRLKSLFVMYLVDNVHPYGPDTVPATTLIQFIHNETLVECTYQAFFQSELMNGFGLAWRSVGLGGLHNWLEVWIDHDHWEIFDATGDVWVDHGYDELLGGGPRRYRFFYTPWLDESKPEARAYAQQQQQDGDFTNVPSSSDYEVYDGGVGIQRALTPGIGIYYPPPLYCQLPGSACDFYLVDASIWAQHPQP